MSAKNLESTRHDARRYADRSEEQYDEARLGNVSIAVQNGLISALGTGQRRCAEPTGVSRMQKSNPDGDTG
jgi:hypothetical protein